MKTEKAERSCLVSTHLATTPFARYAGGSAPARVRGLELRCGMPPSALRQTSAAGHGRTRRDYQEREGA